MLILSMSSGALMVGRVGRAGLRLTERLVLLRLLVNEAPEQTEHHDADNDEFVARHAVLPCFVGGSEGSPLAAVKRGRRLARGRAPAPAQEPERREEQRDPEDERRLDVALLVLAGSLDVLLLLADLVFGLVGRDLQLVAVDEVRVRQELRADREEVGVAAQPVERVLEDEDRAGDELLRVGPGEHEELLVAAEARHHLPVLAHVRAVAGARERVREELRRREDEDARRLDALVRRLDALLVALGEGAS